MKEQTFLRNFAGHVTRQHLLDSFQTTNSRRVQRTDGETTNHASHVKQREGRFGKPLQCKTQIC